MHAVKSLFKPYRVSISVRVFFVRVHVPRGVWVVLYSLQLHYVAVQYLYR